MKNSQRKRIHSKTLFLSLLLMLLCPAREACSSGFALLSGSARGDALSGTLVGRADDPSAIFYNPAGITQLDGFQVMAGTTFIAPIQDAEIAGRTIEGVRTIWLDPHVYGSYQFSDRLWFGVGTFSRFGLGAEFPVQWPGTFNSYYSAIQSASLCPVAAWKMTDKLSLAAGLEIMWFYINLKQKISPVALGGAGEVDQSFRATSFGYGFNGGLHFRPVDQLAFGIFYRSRVKQHLEGDVDFNPNGPAGIANFVNTRATTSIVLPDTLLLGMTVYPTTRLSLEIGGVLTRWSSIEETSLTFDTPPVAALRTVTRQRNWNDSWKLQFGAEYKLLDCLDLRAGYAYDMDPIPDARIDYAVPTNNSHHFSVGTGFHWKKWGFDLSYSLHMVEDRHVNARPADNILDTQFENVKVHYIGSSISYKY